MCMLSLKEGSIFFRLSIFILLSGSCDKAFNDDKMQHPIMIIFFVIILSPEIKIKIIFWQVMASFKVNYNILVVPKDFLKNIFKADAEKTKLSNRYNSAVSCTKISVFTKSRLTNTKFVFFNYSFIFTHCHLIDANCSLEILLFD
jgi:hypothetical protein